MTVSRRRTPVLLAAVLGMAALGASPPPAPAPASPPELTEADATGVLGRMVRDTDGKEIGRVVDVVVDPSAQPRAVVVDVGGFMGVGTRRVAVSWASVHVPPPGDKDKDVTISMSDEQVKAAPDYNDRSKPAVVVGPPVAEQHAAGAAPPASPASPPAATPPATPPPAPEAASGK